MPLARPRQKLPGLVRGPAFFFSDDRNRSPRHGAAVESGSAGTASGVGAAAVGGGDAAAAGGEAGALGAGGGVPLAAAMICSANGRQRLEITRISVMIFASERRRGRSWGRRRSQVPCRAPSKTGNRRYAARRARPRWRRPRRGSLRGDIDEALQSRERCPEDDEGSNDDDRCLGGELADRPGQYGLTLAR